MYVYLSELPQSEHSQITTAQQKKDYQHPNTLHMPLIIRILPLSRGSPPCVCLVAQSCLTLCDCVDCSPPDCSVHGDSPGKNTGVGCHALLQGIIPTQGSNPALSHWRQILYCPSHQRSPRILAWVAYPFSRGTSQPRNRTGVSCIADRVFIS